MQTEKYDIFFEEVKQIVIAAGLSTSDSIEGESTDVIESWFVQQNLALDPSMLSFFKIFGRKKRIKYVGGPLLTSFNSILVAQQRAIDKSIAKSIDPYHPQIREDYPFLDNIIPIFLYYIEHVGVLSFIISGMENSIVYLFADGAEIEVETEHFTFTTSVRKDLFWGVFYAISTNPFQILPLKWMEFYRMNLYSIWKTSTSYLIRRRAEYSNLISQLEQQENRLLGVSEYEEGFISFLNDWICYFDQNRFPIDDNEILRLTAIFRR